MGYKKNVMGKKKYYATASDRKRMIRTTEEKKEFSGVTKVTVTGIKMHHGVLYVAKSLVKTKDKMKRTETLFNPLNHDTSVSRIINRSGFAGLNIYSVEIKIVRETGVTHSNNREFIPIKKWPIS